VHESSKPGAAVDDDASALTRTVVETAWGAGVAVRRAPATGMGNTLKVGNPGALPARNKAGKVAGGTKRQEAEKA
jgi:hypothetical protein